MQFGVTLAKQRPSNIINHRRNRKYHQHGPTRTNNSASQLEVEPDYGGNTHGRRSRWSTRIFKICPDSQVKNITVAPSQSNVSLSRIDIQTLSGPVKINGVQYRRVGNGGMSDFKNLWIELNGQSTTKKSSGTDLVAFDFANTVQLEANRTYTLELKGDMSSGAHGGGSQRFVLFLTDWVNTNANVKIGFFPLAGTDVLTP